MKRIIFAAIAVCALQTASANAQCTSQIECKDMKFSWSPVSGIATIESNGKGELEQSACAVRALCPEVSFDDSGKLEVDLTKVVLPEGSADSEDLRKKLASDCAAVIPSQVSNACYQNQVWQGSADGLYSK